MTVKQYATFKLDPSYGEWSVTSKDGEDHPFSGTKKLNDLAEKGWRVIGCSYNRKLGYDSREWNLLLERDHD